MLMTGKKPFGGKARRQFEFHHDRINVFESAELPKTFRNLELEHMGKGKSIHMASSGYYSTQMQQSHKESDIVKFIGSLKQSDINDT